METGVSRTLRAPQNTFVILSPHAHLLQSINDILTTPIHTRVMRPEYGSRLPYLVDRPMTGGWKLDIYTALADALYKWEPRIKLDQGTVTEAGSGYFEIEISFWFSDTGEKEKAGIRIDRP